MGSISRAFLDDTKKKSRREHNVKREIVQDKQQFEELLMILAGGSIHEYELLKRMSIHDFLIKFSNFAKELDTRKSKPLPHGR